MRDRTLRTPLLITVALILAAWTLATQARQAPDVVTITRGHDRVAVDIGGRPFTALRFGGDVRKLYLHPLLTASGKRVTRGFPMEQVEGESTDHPHQRGVWIGAERLSGIDFWENEPSYNQPNIGTVTLRDVTSIQSGGREGRFTIQADWIPPHGPSVVTETRTMTFRGGADQRVVDIDVTLTARTKIVFEDNHDAILGLRLGTAFEEANGGKAINAEGIEGWERLRGARSAWVDWRATVDGETVGVAVMDYPRNFRFPTPWHVRDYALLFASPFASRDYSPQAPDGSLTLEPGGELRLRYRILIHPPTVDVAKAFERFARS